MKKGIFVIITLLAVTFQTFTPTFALEKDIWSLIWRIQEKDPHHLLTENISTKSDWSFYVENKYNSQININKNDGSISYGKKWTSIKIQLPKNKRASRIENKNWQVIISDNITDIVIQWLDGGIRQIININSNNAEKYYDFPITLPTWYSLSEGFSWSITIYDDKKNLNMIIAKPWAKDANNTEISTYYSIENGNILRQHIEFNAESVFPITADPIWCGSLISSTSWINRWWTHPWSLSIEPTTCWRVIMTSYLPNIVGGIFQDFGWAETLIRTPASVHWDKTPWTSVYNSMYNQFLCHAQYVLLKDKWNLEPTRANVWYLSTIAAWCNP